MARLRDEFSRSLRAVFVAVASVFTLPFAVASAANAPSAIGEPCVLGRVFVPLGAMRFESVGRRTFTATAGIGSRKTCDGFGIAGLGASTSPAIAPEGLAPGTSTALATRPPVAVLNEKNVVSRQRMPVFAVRLACILRGRAESAPDDVVCVWPDGFQMGRIDAARIPAEMIDDVSFRDRPDFMLKDPSVCTPSATVNADLTVAVLVRPACPHVAIGIGVDPNLLLKPVNHRSARSRHNNKYNRAVGSWEGGVWLN